MTVADFAGVCNSTQAHTLYHLIESAEHLWTPIGLTAVDQSAPYYRRAGYWNGAVWFPYQWFIWKALLDLGYGEIAFRIAHTALEIWQTEVAASYHCFEHFIVESRRGLASVRRIIDARAVVVQCVSHTWDAHLRFRYVDSRIENIR